MTNGLIDRSDSSPAAGAGTLSVHGSLRSVQHTLPFDVLFGRGFHLIVAEPDVNQQQQPALAAQLAQVGGQVVVVTDNPDSETAWYDVSGKYMAFMREHNVSAILIRPDFYIYGTARRWEETTAMVARLTAAFQPTPDTEAQVQ